MHEIMFKQHPLRARHHKHLYSYRPDLGDATEQEEVIVHLLRPDISGSDLSTSSCIPAEASILHTVA